MPREISEKSSQFPDKEARYQCWDSRDKYWECLDSGGEEATTLRVRQEAAVFPMKLFLAAASRKQLVTVGSSLLMK
ncbi:uncharacterized protein [Procambarus clarkii]